MSDRSAEIPPDSDESSEGPIGSTAGLSGLSGLLDAVWFPQQESETDPLLGETFDGVTLRRLIAQGGMGRVYEAEQTTPRRPVAVKFVRPGLTSPALLKRFAYEAEILGRLTHPGIAQIHAVGVHEYRDTPLPYFIMEYIAGAKPLIRHAEDHRLSTRQRLSLFVEVCAAVAHGHQRGVIHRDLKPSNILVAETGQVKVIDFGVARATDSDITLTTMHSEVGQLIGTLQYMSPEQFAASPTDIDIRCDVYALGVVLYELLAGRLPYDIKQKAFLEVMRIVREHEPDSLLSHRPTLRRDVAVITEKCLRKEPSSRYASASELAADITRHLNGEPIRAVPIGFWRGLLLLARRHKTIAATAGTVLVSLVVALVAISIFAFRADRAMQVAERAEAEEALQRAAAEAARMRAEAGEARARQRVYASRSLEASRYLNSYQRELTERFWNDAKALFQESNGGSLPLPPELSLIATSLDDSVGLFHGHTGSIVALAVSGKRDCVVTAARDNTIRVWDARTEACIAKFETTAVVRRLAVNPKATRLAAVTVAGALVVFDWVTGESFELEPPENAGFASIAFSPDGRWLAAGTTSGAICLWAAESHEERPQLLGHRDRVSCLGFSPDGSLLGSGSWDETARVWDLSTGRLEAEMTMQGRVGDLEFGPDSRRLLVGSYAWQARILNIEDQRQTVLETESSVKQVAFAAAGSRVVTVARGGVARLWDAESGAELKLLGRPLVDVNRFAVSPDGNVIAAGTQGGSLELWDARSGNPIGILGGTRSGVTSVGFLSNDQLVTAGYAFNARTWQFTHAGGPGRLAFKRRSPFSACAFIPETAWLATASMRNGVSLWDSQSGRLIGQLPGEMAVRTMAVSPDGSRLAAAGIDQAVRVWDLLGGVAPVDFRGHDEEVSAIAFSPDGKSLATGAFDASVRIWNLQSGQATTRFETDGRRVLSLGFSPDGKQLAVGIEPKLSGQRSVQVWNRSTANLVKEFGDSVASRVVSFSPCGDLLAVAGVKGLIAILDSKTGDRIHVLAGHAGQVTSLAFTADSTRLLSSATDATVRLWDPVSGDAVAELKRHQGGVAEATMTPDASCIATASEDGTVRIWGLTARAMLQNRQRATAIGKRIQPLAQEILAAAGPGRRTKLMALKRDLPEDDWRELSNEVLAAAIRERSTAREPEPEAAE